MLGAPGIDGKRVTVLSKDGLTDFMRSTIFSKETKEPELVPWLLLGQILVVQVKPRLSLFCHKEFLQIGSYLLTVVKLSLTSSMRRVWRKLDNF